MATKLGKVVAYDIGSRRAESHDSLIVCNLMTNEKHYISDFESSMDNKLDRVVAYDMEPSLKKSYNP